MTVHVFLEKGVRLQDNNFWPLACQHFLKQSHGLIDGLIGFSTGKALNAMRFPQFHR